MARNSVGKSRSAPPQPPPSSPPPLSTPSPSTPSPPAPLVGTRRQRDRTSPAFLSSKPTPSPPAPTAQSIIDADNERVLATPLSPGQQSVVDAVKNYKSVFFTGCAGTGKSFLLNYLKLTLPSTSTFFTASTGLAAVNVRGSTLHSFAGVGLGQGTKEQLYEQVNSRQFPKKRWQSCRILVVDEVSMIDCALFDKLEYIARRVRRSDRPFGGIQLILTGDFLQLPPVLGTGFCFESTKWAECVDEVIELDSVFRQADTSLVSVLNSVRRGIVDKAVISAFSPCVGRTFDVSDGIVATQLFATRAQVKDENVERLHQLTSPPHTFIALDRGNEQFLETLKKGCNAADSLILKVGAQVMLLKNLATEMGLVNGSRGVVVDFLPAPDVGNGSDIKVDWKLIHGENRWPVVRFISGQTRVCTPETWSVEVGTRPMASRTQVPLMLAWSITMHKCQGMTLDRVSLHLGSVFAHGQAYVALSRIRSLESLSIRDQFEARVINAHPKALSFYEQLRKKQGKAVDEEAKPVDVGYAVGNSLRVGSAPAYGGKSKAEANGWDDEYDDGYMTQMIDEATLRHEEERRDRREEEMEDKGAFMLTPPPAFVSASQMMSDVKPALSDRMTSQPMASTPPTPSVKVEERREKMRRPQGERRRSTCCQTMSRHPLQ